MFCFPSDEALLKDIIIPESEILQVLEEKLNFDDVPWAKNWRQLAYNLKIPREFYEEFDGTSRQRKSPTREMMKCLVGQDPGINLTDIVEALGEIKRNDAIQIITQHVPDTVGEFKRIVAKFTSMFASPPEEVPRYVL